MRNHWRRPGLERRQELATTERCIQAFDSELDYLFASLRRLGGRPAEMEDLAHQVFLVLLRTWRTFPDRRALRLHLFSLAVRVMARHQRHFAVTLVDPAEPRPLVLMALDRVPLGRRAVLVLHELDRVPLAQIADSLSMTRLGVALRLRTARRDLVAAIRQLVAEPQNAPLGCLDLLLAPRGIRFDELLEANGPSGDADDQPREVAGEILQMQDDVFLLESLMDELPDAIYFKDRQSRFTRINRYAAAHYGIVNPALAVGRTDFDFFTEEHAGQALRDEREIIRTGQPLVAIKEKETLPDGKLRWVSTTKLPLRDRDGDIVGILGLSRDITELQEVA
ncbi:MAG: PAS domain-containing protein [Pseudomonadota bacterium]